ncbi:MAG: ABC transporter ATP-binding protein, partial [Betaproteobacteria bacterium]
MSRENQAVGAPPALRVEGLHVDIALPHGTLHAVRNLSFSLPRGEALGIVGESGSGKSMTALALMGLLPPNANRRAGAMQVGGRDLLAMSDKQIAQDIAGRRMAMVFQEPMNSLNPVYTIGRQLTETMLLHGGTSQAAATERAIYLLDKVGIPDAHSRLHQYPHQLSGGQRQRVMIAMALMNEPDLIIADEPTTALDVTVQAQILRLLSDLQREFGMAMILITHDLGIVSRTVDRIAVMYAGELVETGSVQDVLRDPQHPYTRGLLDCVPGAKHETGRRLGSIPGLVPSLIGEIRGCAFANRCSRAGEACYTAPPPLNSTDDTTHAYRCVLPAGWSRNSADMHLGELREAVAVQQSAPEQKPQAVLSARDVSCSFVVQHSVFA